MKKFFHEGRYHWIVKFIGLLLGLSLMSAHADPIPAGINQILTQYKNANIGVQVQSMSSGKIIYQHNADGYYAPGSTLKNFTAVAALSYLGANFTFKTQLLSTTSTVNQGTLHGNLYLKFAGDPTLAYTDLAQLLTTLAKAGVHTLQGNIYLDDSLFEQSPYASGWSTADQNYCFEAPTSAILLGKNCFSFAVVSGKPGQHAVIKSSPTNPFVSFANTAITATPRTRSCALNVRVEAENTYQLSGCMRSTKRPLVFALPVRDPRLYAQNVVRVLIQREGIHLAGQINFQKAPPGLILLAEHDSAPLAVIIRKMLKDSDNMIANALYKRLGASLYGQGTWETGKLAIAQILQKNAGINFSQAHLVDGAGLSHYNFITPQQMSKLLYFAYHDGAIRQPFLNSLPISGVDGTLRNRMGDKTMARRVSAKTGTIKNVSALAGYVETSRHEVLSFVVFVNNFVGPTFFFRQVEDKICTFLAHT